MSIRMLKAAIALGNSDEFADALGWIGPKNRPSRERAMIISERLALAYWEDRGWVDETVEQLQSQVGFPLDPHVLMALHEMGVWVVTKRGGKGSPTQRSPGPLLLQYFHGDSPHEMEESHGGVTPRDEPASHGGGRPSHGGSGPSHGGQPSHSPSITPSTTPSSNTPSADLELFEPPALFTEPMPSRADKKAQEAYVDQLFDEFWQVYPRKEAKAAARKAFGKAMEEGLTLEELRTGLQTMAYNMRDSEIRFWPHGSTWLNQKRWTDEREQSAAQGLVARARARTAARAPDRQLPTGGDP